MLGRIRALFRSTAGGATVEFALVAPLLITMVLGTIQFGMWMSAYNGLRSAADDTGRYVTVRYQQDKIISNFDIAICARNRAIAAPYYLDDGNVTTYVADAATQSITGVTEKSLKIVYEMPSILGFADVPDFEMSYTRPLFVKAGGISNDTGKCDNS